VTEQKKTEFMRLYEPIHAKFEKFCRARVYGELEYKDLMQETILVAFRKFEDIHEPKAFLYYLFGTAIRILANNKRKKKTVSWSKHSEVYAFKADSNLTDQKIEVEHLYTALSMIPEVYREAIILFEIVGFSIKEIASLQNSGESAVKQRLARGRQQLTSILTKRTGQAIND
jgi:RNA polymerase sigma-70 factor (ECF subfamily)